MNKLYILVAVLFFSVSGVVAQESVKGRVVALDNPQGIEKLNILNLNSGKGTTSDLEGYFQIYGKPGDTILFSSVQYKNKKLLISEEIFQKRNFGEILLEEEVNELAEVLVDDIKLTGYLKNDISKISIKDVEQKNSIQASLDKVIELDRKLNPVQDVNSMGGLNIKDAVSKISKVLEKKSYGKPLITDPKELRAKSVEIAGMAYFRKSLGLNDNEITNFLFFCQKKPIFKTLVNNDNALELIAYFDSQIGKFREWRGSELNNADSLRKEVDSI